jgi:hypothetical protein
MNLHRIDVLSEASSEERFRRSQTLSTVDRIQIFTCFGSIPLYLSHLISSRLISSHFNSSHLISVHPDRAGMGWNGLEPFEMSVCSVLWSRAVLHGKCFGPDSNTRPYDCETSSLICNSHHFPKTNLPTMIGFPSGRSNSMVWFLEVIMVSEKVCARSSELPNAFGQLGIQ